ncbi:TPA: hypothetical protein GRR81_22295 [Vibrio parahaemolyticus]|uniref:hypothetical protein n=1 Tax=Vibrio parahaemolyticus TaxID=670 RepID=UPI001A2FB146|nr:hypothetical protein [Vibrio parahaemolyticus]MCF9331293.1 hypothetical protein [Vibrio parahaemolyticus]HAS6443828.1 hypothetical protein [Vibrio parahaemolyticus]
MTLKCQCHQTSTLFPKLNPSEQVWLWLRQRYLANQSFMDYDNIISKSAMHGIGFVAPKESPKCAREDG